MPDFTGFPLKRFDLKSFQSLKQIYVGIPQGLYKDSVGIMQGLCRQ